MQEGNFDLRTIPEFDPDERARQRHERFGTEEDEFRFSDGKGKEFWALDDPVNPLVFRNGGVSNVVIVLSDRPNLMNWG